MRSTQMHRNKPGLLIIAALLLALILQAFPPPTAQAQDDPSITQRQFTTLIDDATATDPTFGPEDGSLELSADKIAFQNANVDVADLLVQATFTNPVASTRHSFDYGITIRERNNGIAPSFLTFIVFESGVWALLDSNQNLLLNDTYADFNGRRDATNTLTIYASQGTVHVGINGDLLGSISTDIVRSGNVWLGSGFYEDDYIAGASVDYTDFAIWELTGSETTSTDSDSNTGKTGDLGKIDQPDSDRSGDIEAPTATPEPTATDIPEPTATDTPEPIATDTPAPTATETPAPTATEPPPPTATTAPEPSATTTTADSGTPVAAEDSLYVDPVTGVSLRYDATWKVVQEATVDGTPTLELTNGTSDLVFRTIPLAADRPLTGAVDDAIATLAADPSLTDVAVATDKDGDPIRSDGVRSSSAQVVALGQDENGDDVELRYYIEVRSITNQPQGLLIIHRAPADSYADEMSARTKITTTIVYPTK